MHSTRKRSEVDYRSLAGMSRQRSTKSNKSGKSKKAKSEEQELLDKEIETLDEVLDKENFKDLGDTVTSNPLPAHCTKEEYEELMKLHDEETEKLKVKKEEIVKRQKMRQK